MTTGAVAIPALGTWRDYVELVKPRVTSLVLVTTAGGFWLGMRSGDSAGSLPLVLLGTALAAGGANALNQWSERAYDALMQRTKTRPLPSGRLSADAARRFGVWLAAAGSLLLASVVHWLPGALAAITIVTYVALYTPMKRATSLCTLVGAVPGALPPMIGWAAARHTLGLEAWTLFGILFLWQLPHFLAIAVLFRDDYARAGFRMLPVEDPGWVMTARHMAGYSLFLLPVSLIPAVIGMSGAVYFYGALILSALYLAVSIDAARRRTLPAMRRLFRASLLYLPLLFGLLVGNKLPSPAMWAHTRVAPPSAAAALPDYGAVPAFSLTDHQERAFTRQALSGYVWIADFIYTTCPGQCLLMSDRLASLQRAFADEPRLRFVSFSVDPERDTPQALAAYARRYGADPRWVLATGPRQALVSLCQDGFHLSVGPGASAREPIVHSMRLALVDPDGRIRGFYAADDAAAMIRVRADARRLLQEPRT